ncbi:hypothetical protein AAMO2058_000556300 [Amorphochlora amoebiformis]
MYRMKRPEEKQGYLNKRGKPTAVDPKPSWRKRWFEIDLHSRQLKYFRHKNDNSAKGEIEIEAGLIRVLRPHEKTYRPLGFAISGPNCTREFFLQAMNQEDLDSWIKSLRDCVLYLEYIDGKHKEKDNPDPNFGGPYSPNEETEIKLNLRLPTVFDSVIKKRLSQWRSPGAIRGYTDHKLISETKSEVRDGKPETCCFAIRRGDLRPNPKTGRREKIDSKNAFIALEENWRCTDMDWRGHRLLCGTDTGELRTFDTAILSEDSIKAIPTGVRRNSDWGVKGEAKMKIADYGEWCHTPAVAQCALNPCKPETALCVSNTQFYLWDISRPTTSPLFSANGSSDALFACSWDSTGGSKFIIAGQSRSIKTLDARKLKNYNNSAVWKAADAHVGRVTDVAWSPLIGHWIASAGSDGNIKIWDLRYNDLPLFTFSSHLGEVTRIAWSYAHADFLVSGGIDRTIRLWNLRSPPHFNVHTHKTDKEVVGVGFSDHHPLKLHGVTASGQAIDLDITPEFMKPYVQHRFKNPNPVEKYQVRSPGSVSGGGSALEGLKGVRTVSHMPSSPPRLARQGSSKISVQNSSKSDWAISGVEIYLHLRDFKNAFKNISELANRYYENKLNQRAIALLKLASGSLFRNLNQNSGSGMKIPQFVRDVSYYIPSDGVRLNDAEEADFKLIQLLKTRIALRTLVQNKCWSKIIDIKDEIVKQLSENGDAFSAQTLDDMVGAILPENFLAGLNFAMVLGQKLREKGTFGKNFELVARRLFHPTIFHGGRVVVPHPMFAGDHDDDLTPGQVSKADLISESQTVLDASEIQGASQDVKAMEKKLERQFRNPAVVLPQLKLVNELHMALSRAFSKSDSKAGSDALYQPAEVVISVMEKYREDKENSAQQILPSMVHRLYINALIQRNKLDKVFIYATSLSHAIRGWRFSVMLDDLLRDDAYPKVKQFFDLALLRDRRRPWMCKRLVQACLMLLRILHTCEHLPKVFLHSAPKYMERFSVQLQSSLTEIFKNPKYDGSQTLEGVMEINRGRTNGQVNPKRDVFDLVAYLKQQVMKIREFGRGHQPLFPEKVKAFRDVLDRVENGVKDGTLGYSRKSIKDGTIPE